MSQSTSYLKYLKYKTKYMQLKKELEGAGIITDIEVLNAFYEKREAFKNLVESTHSNYADMQKRFKMLQADNTIPSDKYMESSQRKELTALSPKDYDDWSKKPANKQLMDKSVKAVYTAWLANPVLDPNAK